jgi:hypothetical protein
MFTVNNHSFNTFLSPPQGAEQSLEPKPALQQARALPFELHCTLIENKDERVGGKQSMPKEKNTERETQYELCNQRDLTHVQKKENQAKTICATKDNSPRYRRYRTR